MQNPTTHNSVVEPEVHFQFPAELKKKKKKRCCEKFKRKGKYCGSCPLKGCA